MRTHITSGFIKIKLLIIIIIVFLIGAALLLSFFSARTTARDQKRVVDVNQIAKAFQIYDQENGFYPYDGALGGAPQGILDYLSVWPTPPSPDGHCTAAENNYDYQQKSLGQDFILSFCLGGGIDSLVPGPHLLTPSGIQ